MYTYIHRHRHMYIYTDTDICIHIYTDTDIHLLALTHGKRLARTHECCAHLRQKCFSTPLQSVTFPPPTHTAAHVACILCVLC